MVFKDLLRRAEFDSLQEFLRTGSELFYLSDCDKKYSERLHEIYSNIEKIFDKMVEDADEREKILSSFSGLISQYGNIYFEIGVITGAKIGYQLKGKLDELS